jgi:DNA-directed RNA polymerase specialized sigma24 family protein
MNSTDRITAATRANETSEAARPAIADEAKPASAETINRDLCVHLAARDSGAFFERLSADDCRNQIARVCKYWSAGRLSVDEVGDVYQETMLSLWQILQDDRLHPPEPLRIVFHVARCRGMDALRRLAARTKRVSYVDDLAILELSDMHLPTDELEAAELAEKIRVIINDRLTDRQKLVFDVYFQNLEKFNPYSSIEVLADLLTEKTNRAEKPESIRSALRQALRKVREGLRDYPKTADTR